MEKNIDEELAESVKVYKCLYYAPNSKTIEKKENTGPIFQIKVEDSLIVIIRLEFNLANHLKANLMDATNK